MKTIKFSLLGAAILALVLTFAFMTSCEKDGGNSDVSGQMADYSSDPRVDTAQLNGGLVISPETATVANIGDTMIFTLTSGSSAGGPFSWSLTDDTAGTIHPIGNGSQALYKTVRVAKNFIYLKDEGSGNGGIAKITLAVASLQIQPSAVTVPVTVNSIQFTAVGGTAPYSWSRLFPGFGGIDTNGLYTVTATNGANTIVLVDSDGTTVFATVTQ